MENTPFMYGKHFASMYTGSMYGKPAMVFAVWGYVISHFRESRKDGQAYVELHPSLLAGVFNSTPQAILDALDILESPDEASRSDIEEGRRLILLSAQRCIGPLHYRVVNGARYKAIRDEDDRREYLKEAQRLSRQRRDPTLSTMSTTVNHGQPPSTHAEGESEEDNSHSRPSGSNPEASRVKYPEGFEQAWKAYPHHGGRSAKKASAQLWLKLKLEPLADNVLAWVRSCASSPDWTKDDGQFVPGMQVWLKKHDFSEPPQVEPPTATKQRRCPACNHLDFDHAPGVCLFAGGGSCDCQGEA